MDRPTAAHKAILASILVASIVIPVRASRVKKLRQGLGETFLLFGLFAVLYLVMALVTAPSH